MMTMASCMRAFPWLVAGFAGAVLGTSAAFAQCEQSVVAHPGVPVQIGLATGKAFVLDTTLAYGSLDVITDNNNSTLRYTAKPGQADAVETVDCEITGEGKKAVTVTIQSVPVVSPDSVYGSVAKTLVLLFALAVLLESALALVFRWRPFVELLNPRAVRPLVAAVVAYWFVWHFELDIVTALINASNPDAPKPVNTGGQILTALVLAGGSAGVNSILVALGFRQVTTQQTQPRPRPDKAWISVRAVRKSGTTSSIDVLIGPEITLASGGKEPPFVGTITGTSGMGVVSFFALDRGRYPNYGGHEVDSNQEIFIVLRDSEKKTDLATWGPHKLAQGAIVDLDLSA